MNAPLALTHQRFLFQGLMKLRKEFKEAVQKKIPPGKMNRAVQSKDARIIYSVIIDSYQTTKGTFIIYVIPDF